MATVRLKFRPSSVADNEGTLYYKVTHKRIVRQINTQIKILPHEWDASHGRINARGDYDRKDFLEKTARQTQDDLSRLRQIIDALDRNGAPYQADDIVRTFAMRAGEGLIAFTRRLVTQLKAAHVPVGEKYHYALNKFIRFHGDKEIAFADITPSLLTAFEGSMRGKVTKNTAAFYMRNLHAIYNRAMDEGLVAEGSNPFRHVYTGVDKTQKRALSAGHIRLINTCDLTVSPKMAWARDLFMFLFAMRGMSFVDMAYLTRDSLSGGYLSYRRRKTQQLISVKWMPCMEEIVIRHATACSADYLLPILSTTDKATARKQYKNMERKVNRQLKTLGRMLGLPVKLTTYVARHSWATAAQGRKIPLAVISQCLGHDSEKTTQIYLADIDSAEVDAANALVLEDIM